MGYLASSTDFIYLQRGYRQYGNPLVLTRKNYLGINAIIHAYLRTGPRRTWFWDESATIL